MSIETFQTDPLRWIQEELKAWIMRDPWFLPLEKNILLADQGDILDNIAVDVAKLSFAIIIEPTEADLLYSGDQITCSFDESNPLTLTVWENVWTNRSATGSRRRASEVAIKLARHFRPGQTPAAPCVIRKARLMSDSNGKCIYTCIGVGRFTLAS